MHSFGAKRGGSLMRGALFISAIFMSSFAFASVNRVLVQESVRVIDPSKSHLSTILMSGDLVVDHMNANGYEVHGPEGLKSWLKKSGLTFVAEKKNISAFRDYPTHAEITSELQAMQAAHPEISSLISVGTSVRGKELWMMKISSDVNQDLIKPEFIYISSMHGNEITGRGLMLRLIRDLLESYGKREHGDITHLIDNTEIYIMPSMNPDGSQAQRRGNANYVDLNRNFPDFTTSDNQNDPSGREPEVQAIMNLYNQRNFSLSANFHGGSEVVNYPWDTSPNRHPDHALAEALSLSYASKVDYMSSSREFPGGVTNGYDWYEVDGGMQDWSSYWYDNLQVTIELSDTKWPDYSRIPTYYEKNKEALIDYIKDIHSGAGIFYAGPAKDVEIKVFQGENLITTKNIHKNEWYKVLPEGDYKIVVSDENESIEKNVTVDKDLAAQYQEVVFKD